ncbi:epiplakin [Tenrec ecaudatus]|uniref:epiplakin n=1 Tax=Tenrec ecaudatus TaxID=94439 RepID=UPI003F5950B6
MNGHVNCDILDTSGTEAPRVPQTGKTMLGSGTTPAPQPEAAPHIQVRSIAGVHMEVSGQTLSLYAAMKQGLLPSELGLALLEAQAVTGGLVDPAQGHLLSVSDALRQGLVGLELKEKLLAAERAFTGYPDPYGGARLPLFQAIGKEVVENVLGRRWLEAQLATGGLVDPSQGVWVAPEPACQLGLLDRGTWHSLEELQPGSDAVGFCDPNTLEPLPYRELLGRCMEASGSGLALLPLKTTFHTLSGAVSADELLEAGVLDAQTAQDLQEGQLTVADVSTRTEVQQYLQGTGGVAGVVLLPTGRKMGFSQAAAEHLLPLGTVLPFLEAQAATRTLVDPTTGRQLWVDEAVRTGLVGPEHHTQLRVAEQAVTGFHDPFSGSSVPLFQAMQKQLVDEPLALRLLEAQLATGGLVCPSRRLRLPMEAALRFGCLDEGLHQRLLQTTGFPDPGAQGSLSFSQLLTRCVTDPETGLAFLPIRGGTAHGDGPQGLPFIDHSTRQALNLATATVSVGKFRGRPVSLWRLLFSEAVPAERRAELAQKHKEGALSVDALVFQLKAAVEQAATVARVTFSGLRGTVTPGELLESEIIDRNVFEQLERGQTSAQEVGCLDSVQRYLQGTGSIAGLLLPGSQERLGIHEARSRGLLRPGTALVLLEAQAATGFMVDPKENKTYSVDEALRAGIIGPDVYAKLLSAERAVTGYTDPYTGEQISLFQAMQRDLIVRDHGVRLLEAQIATGGVIDPLHSHRVPVEVAYQRGYFDRALNLVLLDPADDTKGFFDPNTHENLTYLQLLERCVRDPDTGLRLLPLRSAQPQLVDGATRQAFQARPLSVRYGRFAGQHVSLWELVNSEYVPEHQRRQLLRQFRLRQVTLDQVACLLQTESRQWAELTLPGLHGPVPAHQLLEAGAIDELLLDQFLSGAISHEALLQMDSVHRCLRGSRALGGVVLQPSNRRLSLYQAMRQKLLGPRVGLALLEAQVATGALLDPHSQEALTVDEAVRQGLVGPELYDQLRRAEAAVTGYRDPYSGKQVSIFQAMKKGLVPAEQATRLLEAQVATGGVIDPAGHHHLPMPVAAERGCIDQEVEKALSLSPQTFPSPDGQALTSYAQLLEQCPQDAASGLLLLPLPDGAPAVPTEEQVQEALQAARGSEDGQSLWELLGSHHLTEEERRRFLEDFRGGSISEHQLRAALQSRLRGAELRARTHISLPGPRGEVPAVWLLDAGIISQDTLEALAHGQLSPGEVAMQPAVRACLWGTGCVAGVLLQPSDAKASVARAVQDGLLPAGLGQKLLEAQVACGALIDPIANQRMSVEDAVKSGLVGGELNEQLLLTEKVVTGFPDPCSSHTLSLWQAVERGLVDRAEGLPLLQAQLATGGIVDTVYQVHLPLPAACRLGLLDEAMGQELSSADENVKFFYDPSTRNKVTYQELRGRCIQDVTSGLWLLPLPQDRVLEVDEHTAVALRAMKVPVGAGRFKGQTVSLWRLLQSEYVGAEQRQKLAALCRSGRAAALREVVQAITTLVQAAESTPSQAAFQGLRKQVSASDLFRAQLIDKRTLDELAQGRKTVREVTQMAAVQRFLEGCNFIAGVRIQATGEVMSIPEALRRRLLRPGTALVLLEAQAATGFVIDPVENKKLTVEQAYASGMFDKETCAKLLSAERAVTGYTDPYTGEQISLFQAMQRDLIVRDHGVRLLEAQIATGGIIDPVHSHRVPVEVAYQRGYFDEAMHRVLQDPGDDTKGFFDPNTHENLTYLQLLERCVRDPDTGLYMLQLVQKGEPYLYIDEVTRRHLGTQTTRIQVGCFAGQTISLWELLASEYFTEARRLELVQGHRTGTLSLQRLTEIITSTVEKAENHNGAIQVAGPQGLVSATELLHSGIIDSKTLDALQRDKDSVESHQELARVQRFLQGHGCIAGVRTPSSQEVMGLHEASRVGLIPAGIAALLLEAQAATGFMLDPHSQQRLQVETAVAVGLVGTELQEKLLRAEQAAKGYTGPVQGTPLSLFQAMQQKLVPREEALRLLEVQVATGGIIDPAKGHRVPLHTAYKRGLLNQDTYDLVSDQKLMKKRFVDPTTGQTTTYQELQARCQMDEMGWAVLHISQESEDYSYVDQATRKALEDEWVDITLGRYKGQRWSVWALLNSEYMTEQKKQELVAKYKKDTRRALQGVVNVILEQIAEKERTRKQLWFQGIRSSVTARELCQAEIISKNQLQQLEEGSRSVQEVTEMDAVKRYLEGTSCIAGVLVPRRDAPDRHDKMSIYQAMWKGVLRPGTALVLLEAQAATGFVIDPVGGRRLSVEEAVAAGVVGGEVREKLLSAERAVTGYTDPYTGEQISLFQAMQRDLIVRDHGVRLLEAQIATGGVIDPVHSHRVPVEVAYQRGYFDEAMHRVLQDPGDDTKGFFDPNTHENLTYLQLLERCVRDPDTGLYMLQLAGPGAPLHQLSEELRAGLRGVHVTPAAGALRGRRMSSWELLFHREVPESRRQDLLRRYGAGALTAQEVGAVLTALLDRDPQGTLRAATMEVLVGSLRGPAVPVWDVLASSYVSVPTREELLAQFGSGALGLPQLTRRLTAILEEAQGRPGSPGRGPRPGSAGSRDSPATRDGSEVTVDDGGPKADADAEGAARRRQEQALRAATMRPQVGQFQGQTVSVWEVLWSSYVSGPRREELLAQHAASSLALPALVAALTQLMEEAEERLSRVSFPGLRRQVSAAELHKAKILGPETLRDLAQGTKTLQEVTEMDAVKRYLEGTSCIAGVLVPRRDAPDRHDKMSIYQAMWKGVLRPGTALVLLEAQAATGFVIDPVGGRRLSVEEAVAAGVVGGEVREKLLSAERAVTGYTDPYTGEQISLFQAMQRDLIVRDHGVRLLEAQIATGGVIDPVHSHRVPVEVAYQRGYFDEAMHRVLQDPGDDTKGFFDPNTHENLTYLQLLERCVRDPDTGLYMLQLAGPGAPLHQLSEELRTGLRGVHVTPAAGALRGRRMSSWELLFHREVPESRRQDLLRRYGAGALTAQEVGAALTALLDRDPQGTLRAATMEVLVGSLRGPAVPVWDVLASSYVSVPTREELLAQFGSGALGLPQLTRRLTAILEEAQGRPGSPGRGPRPGSAGSRDSPATRDGSEVTVDDGGPKADADAEGAARRRQEQALRAATMRPQVGQFQGQTVSVWEVLWSSYVSGPRREELLAQHAASSLALPALVAALTQLMEEAEERLSRVSFPGLRRQVSAAELHKAKILGPETLRDLAQGTKTLQEVTEMDAVKRYLEGTSCIAGVLVPRRDAPDRHDKMSIYQAMWKGVLRPGTALVLLEAQAATGFVIDPVGGRRLSVEEAVAAGVVGGEVREKLLSAERAVTGYTDPYTGEQISLFQAMQRDLIVRDHGVRLLEAQIATGGVIDPVHSHRVPVEVAYQRGYFDEAMHRVLQDPGDDTKGFFDPNTHENLTYLQLLERCVRDPDTGLYMLQLAGPGAPLHQLSEELRAGLRGVHVTPAAGTLRGRRMSSWELLFHREVPESRRQDLLRRYGAGALTAQEVGAALTALLDRDPQGTLRAATMEVLVGSLRGPAVPVWDVLASSYVSVPTREELLAQFGSGALGLPQLTRRLTAILEEAQGRPGSPGRGPRPGSAGSRDSPATRDGSEVTVDDGGPKADADAEGAARRRQEQALRAATMRPQVGQFQGQTVSVWEVLWSSYVSGPRREELLAQHAASSLALPALVAALTQLMEEAEERLSRVSFPGLRRQVSAAELHKAKILGPETLRDLAQGTKTLQEVTEMDAVKRYLEGTSCIAGVLVPRRDAPDRHDKMSIYQAMWKGVLRPGTALVLLEAQAATGFVIDPVGGRRLSVEEAVAAGVVGGEVREKLLSAERAVTGYTDPYTGEQISLFQAMQRDLIVRDHGVRLLEAQIATGGVIDPVHSHRVPVEVAYQRGYFDEAMHRVLQDPGDDTKGFFDPNTHENLTYLQLLERCVRDPDTGLYMLQLAGPGAPLHQLSEELRTGLRGVHVTPAAGALRGRRMSSWELLFHREVPESRRQDLLRRYGAGALTAQEVGAALTALLDRDPQGTLRAATMEVLVGSLRGPAVPVWDVLASSYVSVPTREELLAQFGSGALGLPQLTRRLTAILEEAQGRPGSPGRGPRPGSAGSRDSPATRDGSEVTVDDGGPKADADAEGAARRRQEQALRAATMRPQVGQFQGQTVSVWEVLWSSYVSGPRREELLAQHAASSLALPALVAALTQLMEEAEERLSRVSFPGLRRQVSAAELHKAKILGPETLRDLAQGTKTLQEVTEMDAVKRYLEGTSCIAGVLVPRRDAPDRHDKMSIYQAMWKGVLRPGTALVLLEAQAATGFVIDPVGGRRLSVEEAVAAGVVGGEVREKLLSAERAVTGYTDPYTGEQISLFQAMQRDLIVRDHGVRLLEAQIATGGVIDPVHSHRVPVEVAYQRGYFDEAMHRVLQDPGDDTKGFFDPNTHENLTYLQLLERCVRDPDTGLYMLQLAGPGAPLHQLSEELRAGLRGVHVTPAAGALRGRRMSSWELLFHREVPESRRQDLLRRYGAGALTAQEVGAALTALLDRDPQGTLRAATMEVLVGSLRGPAVPVWDVLASSYVSVPTREELLAQFGSGALGLPQLTRRLTAILEEAQGRPGSPGRGPRPGSAGSRDSPATRDGSEVTVDDGGPKADADAEGAARRRQEQALRAATMRPQVGQFQGQTVSVWEVLWSSYVSGPRREELLAQHAASSLALPALVAALTQLMEEAEERLSRVSFPGLRRQVSAAELHKAKILGPETLRDLAQGTKTLQEVTEMDAVKRYLEGTSCIAGVLVPRRDAPDRHDKMSIYQAMWKGVLRPGTALVLLEAQAATGFVIDPVGGRRLSVEEAVAAGVVGGEVREKLLSAERAVTGYTDPYTGEQISLFQAMQRDLIVRDHGVRLLEAQIATGGVIDPVHSHRVPVEVAYQRGYFDEAMHRVLQDPGDDTKGFFDPNTHENLTYLQLLERCVRDPDTGLYMLQLAGPGAPLHQLSEELRAGLRGVHVTPAAGALRGRRMSSWELLFHREVPESRRQDLLRRYGAGALTAQEVGAALTALLDRDPQGTLRAATMEVLVGSLRGPAVPVWDVLASSYVSVPTREELLAQFGSGALGLPQLTRRLTAILEEAQGRPGSPGRGPRPGSAGSRDSPATRDGSEVTVDDGGPKADADAEGAARRRQEQALRAATMRPQVGQFQGQTVSVWEVLWSSYVSGPRREELLAQHAAGSLALPALVAALTQLMEEAEERLSRVSFPGLRRQVSAAELHKAKILGPETLRDLAQGTKTLQEVTEMDAVKRYLEGTSCIAGVLVPRRDAPDRHDKMSIYQAMWKGVLRPGTALVLLEAQAATGFVIDPVGGRRLSVEEAVAAGVVGGEVREKLLSAERAVTGYTDPYTGEQISLFQAMQRDLIVRDHGVRLLEAQIATGGVIDPVHSHRVPVEVAYQRGYFDEAMHRVLQDPGDDTKGFFDPNTHENLTYLQLLERCVRDPDTGLYMLQLAGPGAPLHQLSEELRAGLRGVHVTPAAGALRGRRMSSWELLFHREVPESRRQDLLRRYGAGALTAQEVGAALTALLDRDPQGTLRAATMEVLVGSLRGPAVPVWDVLASSYVSVPTREELLAQFGSGALGLPQLTRRLTAILEEAQGRPGSPGRGPRPGSAGSRDSPATRDGSEVTVDDGGPKADADAEGAARRRQEQALRAATMRPQVGQFQGQTVSVWEVLWSSYVSGPRREELLAQHAASSLALPALVAALTQLMEEAEERLSRVSFPGLRRQVSAAELHKAKILGPETLRDLAQGTKTLQEVTEMDAVKRYLEGTSCIAGVLVPRRDAPDRHDKMSIYQAMWKGVLRPGTALVLLEAQAATGFVIDPVGGRRLSVEEAVAAGVVGGEVREKLLSAERAVTGYTDPYTGEQISLFQAMQRDLIVRDHGVRLLEAQIATGGVIDPVHSHRVPVEVAYQRGYFDEAMHRVLQDPGDDTKGFFDPNTHENLTYLQLLERCVRDPDTGLYMLQLAGPGAPLHQLSEELRAGLRGVHVTPAAGALRGRRMSSWELLFHREVPESRRQDLLRRYGAGALTAQEVGAALTALLDRDPQGTLRAATMEVLVGSLRGPAVPVWDVLASSYVSVPTREELLAQFGSGALGLPQLTRRLTAILEEAQGRPGSPGRGPRPGSAGSRDSPATRDGSEVTVDDGGPKADADAEGAARRRQEQALRAATMRPQVGQFQGQTVSVWEVLWSSYVSGPRREELLAQHAASSLALPALVAALTQLMEEAEERLSRVSFPGLRRQVSAAELHKAKILGPETLRDLAQGTKTLQEVTEMDAVKRYLEGTSCIAGVLVPRRDAPDRHDKMSIYQAMWKGVLRPGTALVLLEAQAATGFVIDPVGGRRLSVEEAVAAGVVGGEVREKLLSAERAVTGYTDPYTGEQISLFQAMQRDLIVRDHGVRLLEAQIATGGVIDPVHSHRVPVEVAYQRGYFDEAMHRVLQDPGDDTKGFFDPNTHENLTYLQLLERCVRDPDTGLLLLCLKSGP